MTPRKLALVVEDDADVRDVVAVILTEAGYRVVVAVDGLAAFERLAFSERPAVVLLDLMLPRMSGSQLLDQMRQFSSLRDVPVVGMSALRLDRKELAAFDAFVVKPFDRKGLLSAVARAVTLKRPEGTTRLP